VTDGQRGDWERFLVLALTRAAQAGAVLVLAWALYGLCDDEAERHGAERLFPREGDGWRR